jgi:hypothetical protein
VVLSHLGLSGSHCVFVNRDDVWTGIKLLARSLCGLSSVKTFGPYIGYREHELLQTSVLIVQEARDSRLRMRESTREGACAPYFSAPGDPSLDRQGNSSFDGTVYQRLGITLLLLRWARATYPRDKVYALLGISSGFQSLSLPLRPNYTLSLPAS